MMEGVSLVLVFIFFIGWGIIVALFLRRAIGLEGAGGLLYIIVGAIIFVIIFQYQSLPGSLRQVVEAYNAGDRRRLMVAPPSGDAVMVERYADEESCKAKREALVRESVQAGRSVPALSCERSQHFWVPAVAWLTGQLRRILPP
jgi:hypothetical protein